MGNCIINCFGREIDVAEACCYNDRCDAFRAWWAKLPSMLGDCLRSRCGHIIWLLWCVSPECDAKFCPGKRFNRIWVLCTSSAHILASVALAVLATIMLSYNGIYFLTNVLWASIILLVLSGLLLALSAIGALGAMVRCICLCAVIQH